ncbi:hypothetical protein LNTAR_21470 [Lentisphaera araneosa HTCC2155]|uniref:ThuA-like domain-containing protein n=1 Tax=Lentisphaera araneosa HTCC2155 TaxID=313628 RepID=A6DM28_9BACT|nr:ThuA domain-containing protein [Lentisphaera araneosa]EDM27326.1 hypothetical protein LNTAR_21470 [Lentisphaera araneosa HTCC2155]
MKKITMLLIILFTSIACASTQVKPIQVLMITGGGWHDYKKQAPVLKEAIESQINAEVTIKWTSTKEHPLSPTENKLPEVFKGDFCKGYDVVFHNHCQVFFKDDDAINKVIDNHIKNKVGVIMTHGSFHTWFKTKREAWDRICGINSIRHHHNSPLKIEVTDKTHPVMKALGTDGWQTEKGELYETSLKKTTQSLATGTTLTGAKHTEECIFSHTNLGIKMFGTTLGHDTSTMEQDVYKKMMALGILWAANKLDKDGKVSPGYQKKITVLK